MEKKMTLLEKAKAAKVGRTKRVITDEEIELSLAWLKGEITTTQASKSIGSDANRTQNILLLLANCLRQAYVRKMITVK